MDWPSDYLTLVLRLNHDRELGHYGAEHPECIAVGMSVSSVLAQLRDLSCCCRIHIQVDAVFEVV